MQFEVALLEDHQELTDLMRISKNHWGYGEAQIKSWEEELTVSQAYISSNEVYKLVDQGLILGFFSYLKEPGDTVKLENMFLLPAHIGKGIGRLMMDHFLVIVGQQGYQKVILDADPNAERFYDRMGFKVIDKIPTSIPGRYMPIMELSI